MQIILWTDIVHRTTPLFPQGSAVTIGGFDGPHCGHTGLFSYVLKAASEKKIPAGIITFSRSPRVKKEGSVYKGDVSTLRMRLEKIEAAGFDFTILIDFSNDFARMEGIVFFDILMKTICIKYLAVGNDFSCGYRHDTGVKELQTFAQEKGFCFDSIEQICSGAHSRISSSTIRQALAHADFTLAKELLGYPFSLDVLEIPQRYTCGVYTLEKKQSSQIVPAEGHYSGMIYLKGGLQTPAHIEIDTDTIQVFLENKKLSSFSTAENNKIELIEFIRKE